MAHLPQHSHSICLIFLHFQHREKNIDMRFIPLTLSPYSTFISACNLFSTCRTAVVTLNNVKWENKYRHLNSLNSNFSASERESVLKDGGEGKKKKLCRWFNILKVTWLSLRTGNEKWDARHREGINSLIICENDLWNSFYANVKHAKYTIWKVLTAGVWRRSWSVHLGHTNRRWSLHAVSYNIYFI